MLWGYKRDCSQAVAGCVVLSTGATESNNLPQAPALLGLTLVGGADHKESVYYVVRKQAASGRSACARARKGENPAASR